MSSRQHIILYGRRKARVEIMMGEFLQSVGKTRRSQGVSTFGIGAVVDFTTGSYMPLGLSFLEQQWYGLPKDAKDAATFYEPRLQRLLGVKAFRSLPTP